MNLQELIKKRKEFLANNSIEDWNETDTIFIATEFAKEFAEWVDNIGYTQVANSEWKSISDLKGETTDQLIQLFINKQ